MPTHDPARQTGLRTPRGRNVSQRGLELRHTFASLLIAQGADVVHVSRQIGHASPKITLDVYAHLFDAARHAEHTRDRLEAAYGNLLKTSGGNAWRNRPAAAAGQVVMAVETRL